MVVREDRAPDDGKIGVRADEIVRETRNEAEQFRKGRTVDLHRLVFFRERDAMLVVVDVGRILQIPAASVHVERDLAQVLSCGLGFVAGVALVFVAEQALRIAALGQEFRRRDRLRILLGFGEVDRELDLAVARIHRPAKVAFDAVAPDVVGVAGEFIEPIGRLFRIFRRERFKAGDHLRRTGRQDPHQRRVEKIAVGHGVGGDQPGFYGVIAQPRKDLGKFRVARLGKPPVERDGELVGELIREVDAVEGGA